MRRIFTRGLAFGDGFCNRIREIQDLSNNIRNGTHTLLSSPRRYGKTSLALYAIEKEKIPYAHLDLFMKYGNQEILNEFYAGIGRLWSQLVKPSEKMLKKIESFLQNIKISLQLGRAGLEFTLTPRHDDQKSLRFLLEGLDAYLVKNRKQVVIFVDEMQGIAESKMCDEVESSLRFIAQKTKNIIFIFSGSNRHLLSLLFEDKSRPFYKLCHPMHIQKIAPEHYFKHLNKFAQKKWQQKLPEEVLTEITRCTDCHPYYMNVLCEKIFADQFPTVSLVQQYWQQVCYEEQGAVGRDLEFLTGKQKQLLAEIARHPGLKEPSAKEFVNKVNLTPKGVLDALKILIRYDLVERNSEGMISVIDPVIGFWARN